MKHFSSLLALPAFLPQVGYTQDNHPNFPDRPGITESPFTVDAGHLQIETDLLRLINEPSSEDDPQRRTWHTAFATVKLGLSRKTDVQLEVPLYSVQK